MPSPSPTIMEKKKTERFGDNVWCQVRGGLWDFCTQCAYGDRGGKLLELLEGGRKEHPLAAEPTVSKVPPW